MSAPHEGPRPLLFYDLGSPYAYLAVERAERVLGVAPELRPVLLGAIFKLRGRDSWGFGPERAANQAEVERRAERYGLPPLRWPDPFPAHTLAAMRAVVWAGGHGLGEAFARAAFRRAFADGADLADLAVLEEVAAVVGLPAAELEAAVSSREVKQGLRDATDAAWGLGVAGAPWVIAAGRAFFGDDRLEEAAAVLQTRSAGSARA